MMRIIIKHLLACGFGLTIYYLNITSIYSQTLWDVAKNNKDFLTVATLFTAQDIRDHLSSAKGIDNAVNWCKQTGVTKVYLESFRHGYFLDNDLLIGAKTRFLNEGFEVSGCVTPTRFEKKSIGRGWESICYSNKKSQEKLQQIFEYTASVFDEIMIDDFLFTECECEECLAALGDQTWSEYRCDLMVKMGRERILKPAKTINPKVKIINKYPLWYDDFHKRGYEVSRQSRDFDLIYVGTETRDYDYSIRSSGEVQYGAYFNMRWLGGIAGEKTLGGWFDAYGTTPNTYLEQARQTILGGTREIFLFCYSILINENNNYNGWRGTGIDNVNAFKEELSGLFELAKIVHLKPIQGIHLPKIPNSDSFEEPYIYSFLGMLGIPLVPSHEFNENAQSAIFPVHILKIPDFSVKLQRMLDNEKFVLITDGLAKRLTNQTLLKSKNLTILNIEGEPKNLLKLTREEINPIRNKLMKPLGLQIDAPNKVGLYLFGENYIIVENFNDEYVDVTLSPSVVTDVDMDLILPKTGNAEVSKHLNDIQLKNITPRTLVVIKYQ